MLHSRACFYRIRHYGLLANGGITRANKLAHAPDAQFVLTGAERRLLRQQHPFAASVGDAARDLLAAVEKDDLGAGGRPTGDHSPAVRADAGTPCASHGPQDACETALTCAAGEQIDDGAAS